MYKYYNEKDVMVGIGEGDKPRPFSVDEKYYKQDDGVIVLNDSYDASAALYAYTNDKIRNKRRSLLKAIDPIAPIILTSAQQAEIETYKQSLRDLTENVTMDNVDSVSFPDKPQILIDLGY